MHTGSPIKGELHSTDAHAGVLVPIYNAGSNSARTLAANEYIEIESIEVVGVPGGDVHVFLGDSGSPAAGQTVIRGTVTANGGVVMSRNLHAGKAGQNAYVVAPAGVVDVNFSGVVKKFQTEGLRPSWRESQIPGV